MKFIEKHKYDLFIFLIFLAFAVFLIEFRDKFGVLSDRDSFERLIRSFGIFAPLAIIAAIIIEVVLAPIPGFIPAITAGFIFFLWFFIYLYGKCFGIFSCFLALPKIRPRDCGKVVRRGKAHKIRKNDFPPRKFPAFSLCLSCLSPRYHEWGFRPFQHQLQKICPWRFSRIHIPCPDSELVRRLACPFVFHDLKKFGTEYLSE